MSAHGPEAHHRAGERVVAAATAPMPGLPPAGHRRAGGREPLGVTALFDSPDGVDRALDTLYTAGIPRDLVEVVVSREAAERYYAGASTQGPGRETFRYAGIGGLIGFVGGVIVSLVAVAWPGIDAPGGHAIVQLAGPNFGTTAGAAVGALIGWTRRQQPDPRHARAAEASGAIVVSVGVRDDREAVLVARLLESVGGREARVEQG